jgi:hypothetical protein
MISLKPDVVGGVANTIVARNLEGKRIGARDLTRHLALAIVCRSEMLPS